MPGTRFTPRNILGLLRYAKWRVLHPHVSVGLFFMDRGADIHIERGASLEVGSGVRFLRDCTVHVMGTLSIGSDVFFNRGCHIVARESVRIGSHCLFGEHVSIHDENHVVSDSSRPIALQGFTTEPITIGSNVWSGAKATILPGVSIGDNAVVGANAVVTRDVPPRTVVGGVPAKVIRTL